MFIPFAGATRTWIIASNVLRVLIDAFALRTNDYAREIGRGCLRTHYWVLRRRAWADSFPSTVFLCKNYTPDGIVEVDLSERSWW
jgi:hypothetical protein